MSFFLRKLILYCTATLVLVGCTKTRIVNWAADSYRLFYRSHDKDDNKRGKTISISLDVFVKAVTEILDKNRNTLNYYGEALDNHEEQFDFIFNCMKDIIDEQIKQKKYQEESEKKELSKKLKQGLDVSFQGRQDQGLDRVLKELKAYIDQKFDALVKPIQNQNSHIINQSELTLQPRQPYSSSGKQRDQNNSARLLPIEHTYEASSYPCQDCNDYYSLGKDQPDVDCHKPCVDALLYRFLKNTWPFNLYINHALKMNCNLSYNDICKVDYARFCFDYYNDKNSTDSAYKSFQVRLKYSPTIVDARDQEQLNQFEDFYRRCNRDRLRQSCSKCRAYYREYFSQDYEKDWKSYRTYDYNDSRLKRFIEKGQLFHKLCAQVLIDQQIKEYKVYVKTYRRANNGLSPSMHEISQAFNQDEAAVTNSFMKCKALKQYAWSPF